MNFKILWVVMVVQMLGVNCCFLEKKEEFSNSFIPACIQVLHYYKIQLQKFHPYTFTPFCGFGGLIKGPGNQNSISEEHKSGENSSPISLSFDVCVDETLSKINLFILDLKREAAKKNMENFQGFSYSVLQELEKTSTMTSAQQLHFILEKIKKDDLNNVIRCKITKFMNDLNLINSKMYKNFLILKPLIYSSKK